jgi:hypothetical protein
MVKKVKKTSGNRGKVKNPWMDHLAYVRSKNPSVKGKAIFALAKKTYTPLKK